MRFSKYHALGNDYLVVEANECATSLASLARLLCHRNCGIGSDGILLSDGFSVRIINPDGSEAEKSGNGLRILARYLFDQKRVNFEPFKISTLGGNVTCQLLEDTNNICVQMGRVSFDSAAIPVAGPRREVINETLVVNGKELLFSSATIGNPHCVVLCDQASDAEAKTLGPLIETNPLFPNRTNVQFLQVLGENDIKIEIWERGAGYTLASGSSSCAAAAVARRLGLCGPHVRVHMQGGCLDIDIADDYAVQMLGPVTKVAEGLVSDEILHTLLPETTSQDYG